MRDWVLAIDFGTTSTAAAMRVENGIQLVAIDGAPSMPSMVFWREGTASSPGELVIGRRVENLASRAPWCLERTPKRRVGQDVMQLGQQEVRVTDAIAAILRKVAAEASRLRGGQRPTEVRLTHPVRWGQARLEQLRVAAAEAGLGPPVLLAEPVAAATYFAGERLATGEHVAVYDLGGGTFDTAVLRRTASGFEAVGRPGGREDLGGENFDNALYRHLGAQLPAEQWEAMRSAARNRDAGASLWREVNLQLQREAHLAKEILSDSPDYEARIAPPVDAYLAVTAAELNELIRSDLEETVAELRRTIATAGIEPSALAAIYLAGGSSRIPLVSNLLKQHFGQSPQSLDDPKSVIALGAARAPVGAYDRSPGHGPAHLSEAAREPPARRPTTRRVEEPTVALPPRDIARVGSATRTARPRGRIVLIAAVSGVVMAGAAAILLTGSHGPRPATPTGPTPSTGDVQTLVATYARVRSAHDVSALSGVLAPAVNVRVPGGTGGFGDVVSALQSETRGGVGTNWRVDLNAATITTGPGQASVSGRYSVGFSGNGQPPERGSIEFVMREATPGALRIAAIVRYPDRIYKVRPNGQRYAETDRLYVDSRGSQQLLGTTSMTVDKARPTYIYVPLVPSVAALLGPGTVISNRRTFSDGSPARTDVSRYVPGSL